MGQGTPLSCAPWPPLSLPVAGVCVSVSDSPRGEANWLPPAGPLMIPGDSSL